MELRLPNVVMTKSDLLRLTREFEALDRFFTQYGDNPDDTVATPRTSKSLEAFIRENEVNIQDKIVRKTILEFLDFLKKSAPSVHMSFAKDPPASALVKIVEWFRREIHPRTIIDIGVQPNIAGGCMLRSGSKIFDFSLRQHLNAHKSLLKTSIAASVGRKYVEAARAEMAHEANQ